MADTIKLVTSLVLLAVAMVAFYYFAQYSIYIRVTALLLVAGGAVALASQTIKGRAVWAYIGDSRTEVRKVVWPTRQETVQTTMIVMVMVIVAGFFLWLLDMALAAGVKWLTGQGI
ncbi:MAG: preprotein translocase subunit SecE [Gammaproteobacteria bacterium]|nr:preprotein translocase subunit SecE [Gammaproteobacteria bacterium]